MSQNAQTEPVISEQQVYQASNSAEDLKEEASVSGFKFAVKSAVTAAFLAQAGYDFTTRKEGLGVTFGIAAGVALVITIRAASKWLEARRAVQQAVSAETPEQPSP